MKLNTDIVNQAVLEMLRRGKHISVAKGPARPGDVASVSYCHSTLVDLDTDKLE